MNKLYMLGATVLTSMVFAVSVASPALAHGSNGKNNSDRGEKSGHQRNHVASNSSEKHDSDHDDDNDERDDNNKKSKYSQKTSSVSNSDKHEDNSKKQHTDCHVKVSPNYNKYPSKDHCKKATIKKAVVKKTTVKPVVKTAVATPEQSKDNSVVLPNTGGASNIALAIGALVAAAGYCANLLRLKLRTDQ